MKLRIFTILIFSVLITHGQEQKKYDDAVYSIEGIVTKMLDIISAEKGETRDWETFKSLFTPNVTFSVLTTGLDYPYPFESINLDDFVESMQDEYYDAGFEEYGLGHVVNEYNGLANVFQSFYGKDSEGSEIRGINSYQLVYFQDRWWISNLTWTFETPENPIPDKYLNNKTNE